jgi:hypothetical protein
LFPKKQTVEPGQTGKRGEFEAWADEIHAQYPKRRPGHQ